MTATLHGGTLWGVQGEAVQVQVDVARGLPAFRIVGLPATAVREARERVRSAVENSGYKFPLARITVNLAPAERPKPLPTFDLAIALGILYVTGQIPGGSWQDWMLLGELGLDGSLRPVRGLLPLAACSARLGLKGLAVGHHGDPPWELAWIDTPIRLFQDLRAAVAWTQARRQAGDATHGVVRAHAGAAVAGISKAGSDRPSPASAPASDALEGLRWLKGQPEARRALEIAAAGRHHLLLIGPPGTGKTMLAKALPALLPPLSAERAREAAAVWSVCGEPPPAASMIPVCMPHHTVTKTAMLGGGADPGPGHLSQAHGGLLILDEVTLFRRDVIDALRQPLESGEIVLHRLGRVVRFPCDVQLVATCNPCPCGYYGDGSETCTCTPYELQRYWATLPGPILDRIDLFVHVGRPSFAEVSGASMPLADMDAIRLRVQKAAAVQRQRGKRWGIERNRDLLQWQFVHACPLSAQAKHVLALAFDRHMLSVRGYERLIRVARTIADLDESPVIEEEHIAEAMSYRPPRRLFE